MHENKKLLSPITNNNEKYWINILKFFCIFFVFWNHCEVYSGFSIPYSYSIYGAFFVNAFFFIAGYFFIGKNISILQSQDEQAKKSLYLKNIKNILFKLIIPSLIFSLVVFLPSAIIKKNELSVFNLLYKTVGGGTYWFTSALVVAELILLLCFIFKIKNVWFYFGLAIVFFCAGHLLNHFNVSIISEHPEFPWHYQEGLLSTIFLGIGGLYSKYENKLEKLMKWYFALPSLLIYISLSISFPNLINTSISSKSINIFGVFISLLSIFSLVYFSKKITKDCLINRILNFIGRNSIGFYFMSGALPTILNYISKKMISNKIAIFVLILILSLIIAFSANYILIRFIPAIFDLRKIKLTEKQKN